MNRSLRILWLKTGPLHPLDTGGKIRTGNMLRELKKRHHLTYLALCQPGVDPGIQASAHEYSHEQIWIPWRETPKLTLRFYFELLTNLTFSRLPYVIEKYRSRIMARKIRELDTARTFDLIICDFVTPGVNLYASGTRPFSPTLLFQHNVESKIWERTFQTARGALKKPYFREQWQRMLAFEKTTSARFDGVVAVSAEECRIMREGFALPNVLGAVSTGVDVAHFVPSGQARKPRSLVFLGSMDWMPNIDAVKHFVAEILPLLKAQFPDIHLTIVGRNPPPGILELAQNSTIHVTGTVADVRPYLAEAQIMIVPLRIGGGTRIKIFEGMASGIPVVSTPIGAEGLPVKHGEHLLLAETAAEFAQAIQSLFNQPDLGEQIGRNGRHLVARQFSWGQVVNEFEQFCIMVAGGSSRVAE